MPNRRAEVAFDPERTSMSSLLIVIFNIRNSRRSTLRSARSLTRGLLFGGPLSAGQRFQELLHRARHLVVIRESADSSSNNIEP